MDIQRLRFRVGLVALAAACLVTLVVTFGPWDRLGAVERGVRLVSDGEYLRATRVLAKAVAVSPQGARAHYYFGLAYGGIRQNEASLAALARRRPARRRQAARTVSARSDAAS